MQERRIYNNGLSIYKNSWGLRFIDWTGKQLLSHPSIKVLKSFCGGLCNGLGPFLKFYILESRDFILDKRRKQLFRKARSTFKSL